MLDRIARQKIKAFLSERAINQIVKVEKAGTALRAFRGRHRRECNICGYKGWFLASGLQPLVYDSMCPQCRSIGRHRQHHLLVSRHPEWIESGDILHFAPEPCFVQEYTQRSQAAKHAYLQADYFPSVGEVQVDIQNIQYPDNRFHLIICHNVLEHVPDDRKALAEIRRVVRPGGVVVLSVPLIDAWDQTYEDPSITSSADRDLHFNQDDHYRLYGRDFYDRLRAAGFALDTYVAKEPEVSRYSLERGETIFIATKAEADNH